MVKGRKGFAVDLFLTVVLLFVVAIAAVVAWYFMGQIDVAFRNETQISSTISGKFTASTNVLDNTFDAVVLTLLIGIVISLAGISYVLRTNPVMFMLVWLVTIIVGAVAGYLSNAWVNVTSGVLSTSVNNFPITEFLMQNYMIITIVNAFLMLIIFFGTPGGDGV